MPTDPTIALSWGLGGVVVLSAFYAAKRALEKGGWIDQANKRKDEQAKAQEGLYNELRDSSKAVAGASVANSNILSGQAIEIKAHGKVLGSSEIKLNAMTSAAIEHCRFLSSFLHSLSENGEVTVPAKILSKSDIAELQTHIDKVQEILEHGST